jgi:NAD(P)-dependent dehydrogenase (short-subunit alcohol dehydrogenase family)
MINKEKYVLITGAAGGIGSAAVKLFKEKGWRVIGVDRKEFNNDFPKNGKLILADISKADQIEHIFSKVKSVTSNLNAIVNNAAIQISKPLIETTLEEWDLTMASNMRSVFLTCKLAHPFLAETENASIVNVSSVHAVATSANISAYAASKGGLLALTRAMAIEFAPDNIRVNAVLPGAVDTSMLRKSMTRRQFGEASVERRLDNLASKTVIGRIGKPSEIASTIYFLADYSQSSFITGQALIADGGATARLSTE